MPHMRQRAHRRSGETGNRTQQLSILFVLVLLLVVFRSVLAL